MLELRKVTLLNSNKKEWKPILVVPEKVERIIRYFCASSPANEWSGVLFYKTEGTFKDRNFKVICEDIYLMDVGSATYTEFDIDNADTASYMASHPELFDCKQGLVH